MLAQPRRLWANITPAFGHRLVLDGAASACTMETAGKSAHKRGHGHTEQTEVNQYVPHRLTQGKHNKIYLSEHLKYTMFCLQRCWNSFSQPNKITQLPYKHIYLEMRGDITVYRTLTGVIDHETCTDNFLYRPKPVNGCELFTLYWRIAV